MRKLNRESLLSNSLPLTLGRDPEVPQKASSKKWETVRPTQAGPGMCSGCQAWPSPPEPGTVARRGLTRERTQYLAQGLVCFLFCFHYKKPKRSSNPCLHCTAGETQALRSGRLAPAILVVSRKVKDPPGSVWCSSPGWPSISSAFLPWSSLTKECQGQGLPFS